ncbi:MAG: hypothetical protein R3E39_15270 [Anaerolineae bacterium]
MSFFEARFQFVWNIFHCVNSLQQFDKPFTTLEKLLKSNSFKLSSKLNVQNLIDAIDQSYKRFPVIPEKIDLTGPAIQEMRVYAQKKRGHKQFHRSFYDEINIRGQVIQFEYTIELFLFEPNIFLIEIRTKPIICELSVTDINHIAFLPKGNNNLYLYLSRLIRMLEDWDHPTPLKQRTRYEVEDKRLIIPNTVIGIEDANKFESFVEQSSQELVGIITRHSQWEYLDAELVKRVLDKDVSIKKKIENIFVDKQGIVICFTGSKDIRSYREEYSTLRLAQIAYSRLLLLRILGDDITNSFSQKINWLIEIDNALTFSIEITKSVRLKGIWTQLVREYEILKQVETVRNRMGSHQNTEKKDGSMKNREISFKVVFVALIIISAPVIILTLVFKFIGADILSLIVIFIFALIFVLIVASFILAYSGLFSQTALQKYYNRMLDLVPPLSNLITRISQWFSQENFKQPKSK